MPLGRLAHLWPEYTDPAKLDDLVRQAREALARAGTRRAQRAAALANLAHVLHLRHVVTELRADLDEGMTLLREARSLTPSRHPLGLRVDRMFALLLCGRRQRDDLVEAIDITRGLLDRGVLDATQDGMLLLQLGMALMGESQRPGAEALLDEGIEVLERATERLPAVGSSIGRVRADMLRFALALGLAGRCLTRWSSDKQDADRAQALLADLDMAGLSTLVPGLDEIRQQVEHALGLVLSDGPTHQSTGLVVAQPAPPRSLLSTRFEMLRNSASVMDATYNVKDDLGGLDEQINALHTELARVGDDEALHGTTSVVLAGLYQLRFRTRYLSNAGAAQQDLDQALRFARAAFELSLPEVDGEASAALGRCLLDRYGLGLGTAADVEESIRLLRRAMATFSADSRTALALSGQLAEALIVRGTLTSGWEDIDEAEELLVTLCERLPAGSPLRPIAAVRLTVFLQRRSVLSGDTEDLLRASAAARASTQDAANVSAVWAYDAALSWARWSWHQDFRADRADAHQQAVRCLYRLARGQMDHGHAELALRRDSEGLLARAVRALAADHRFTDAVVAAETGRAVLLSSVLERNGPVLDATVPAELRRRFDRAGARLRAAETAVRDLATDRLTPSTPGRNP